MPQMMRRFGREQGQRFVQWNQLKPLTSFFGTRSFRQHEEPPAPPAGGGGGTPPGGGAPGGGTPPPPEPGKTTFTQDEINSIVKKEREGFQKKHRETLKQLEDLRAEKTTTAEQAAKLDKQINTMRTELMSEKERAEAEKHRIEDEHKRALSGAEDSRDEWRVRYERSTIEGEIVNAAVKHKAVLPDQLIRMIDAKMEEGSDDEGKPNGVFSRTVETTVKEGEKDVVKKLSIDAHVEWMKGQEQFANLFLATGKGGTGYRKGSKGGGGGEADGMSADEMITEGLKRNQTSVEE